MKSTRCASDGWSECRPRAVDREAASPVRLGVDELSRERDAVAQGMLRPALESPERTVGRRRPPGRARCALARLAFVVLAALAALAALLAPASQAGASEESATIGVVKTVQGEAWVATQGVQAVATPGTRLTRGSVVRTGASGAIGMTLKDGTILALGADSELVLDDFRYAPASGAFGLVIGMVRGTLEFVSGAIARLRPESVRVQTPSATLGVRGTHFLVKVEQ